MASRTDGSFRGWPQSGLDWFDELELNNDRDWFRAHKATYDHDVRGPLAALLGELADEFGAARISRPNRDTRFSADKAPYKTNIYARIDRPGGGYYVSLDADRFFVGGGVYSPDRDRLAAVRAAIADERSGADLEQLLATLQASGARLITDGALKTAPRGYTVDHPRIDLLRLPHLAGGIEHRVGTWIHTAKAKDRVVAGWRAVTPLLDWVVAST